MKATISGQAGLAIVEDDGAWLYSIESPDKPTVVPPALEMSLFRGVTDTFSVDVESRQTAVDLLSDAWERDRLLQMFIIILRSDADFDIRCLATEAAEDLLNSFDAQLFVLNRLYSRPLTDADLDGALMIARETGRQQVRRALIELFEHQRAVIEMDDTWRAIESQTTDRIQLASLRRALEETDIVRRLATASSRPSLEEVVAQALNIGLIAQIPCAAEVLQQLVDARSAVEDQPFAEDVDLIAAEVESPPAKEQPSLKQLFEELRQGVAQFHSDD